MHGPDHPDNLEFEGAVMVTSPDKKTALMISGNDGTIAMHGKIARLECSNEVCTWTLLTKTLNNNRFWPTAMLIPDYILECP